MMNELDRKIMIEFVGFKPKTYSYLTDDDSGDKKQKDLSWKTIKNAYNIMKLY